MSDIKVAVIGGSGLYEMKGLAIEEQREIETPYGMPSAPIMIGKLQGARVAFLARHGIGHRYSPTEVNYRANIYALKLMGVERIIAVSACGSLREDFAPGDVVLPNQIYDHTTHRARSFFGDGLIAHVNVARPFCPELTTLAEDALKKAGGCVHTGGDFITIEGPRFSTKGESDIYRSWGLSIVGMTTSPEAFLAKEAEMCYVVMAHVTDYDVWNLSEETVTVDMVIKTLRENTELITKAIINLLEAIPDTRRCKCEDALDGALITDPSVIPEDTKERLFPIVGRYLP